MQLTALSPRLQHVNAYIKSVNSFNLIKEIADMSVTVTRSAAPADEPVPTTLKRIVGQRKSRRKATETTSPQPEPQAEVQLVASPADRFVAQPGDLQVVQPTPAPEPPAEQPKPEEPAEDPLVEVKLEGAREFVYVLCVHNGKQRWLDRSKIASFDQATGTIRLTKSLAKTWKLVA